MSDTADSNPTTSAGHLCTEAQLMNFLRVVGADTDAEGKYLVTGTIASFMGMGREFVIGPDARYFRAGRPCGLAAGLRCTSYGLAVTVI